MTQEELEIERERARVWAEAAIYFRPALVCGDHGWRPVSTPCPMCQAERDTRRPLFAQPDAQVGVL